MTMSPRVTVWIELASDDDDDDDDDNNNNNNNNSNNNNNIMMSKDPDKIFLPREFTKSKWKFQIQSQSQSQSQSHPNPQSNSNSGSDFDFDAGAAAPYKLYASSAAHRKYSSRQMHGDGRHRLQRKFNAGAQQGHKSKQQAGVTGQRNMSS
ncbi:hypothetical protein EYC80_002021 [Monilinia laxa]|uniref:Uncharacterized protein n=1 Tax=Monilinia laxa TaxID=61186 RepID=A0A5N6K6X7_MONLA|nr:hypothetical protein EYC80_002021 [Monilinia laxa]